MSHISILTQSVAALAAASVFLATPSFAFDPPSAPFLEKNAFYLRSAGFKVRFAKDAAGERALKALPSHRFVVRTVKGQPRYVYAEPKGCGCIFSGTADNYASYRDMLRSPAEKVDDVSPDYKTQARALLDTDPASLDGPMYDTVADYLRDDWN